MNRLLVPAFSILLLSALPVQAAPGDDHPGQATRAPEHRPPAAAPRAAPRAAPPRAPQRAPIQQHAPVQPHAPMQQRAPVQQRAPIQPRTPVQQRPAAVAPQRQLPQVQHEEQAPRAAQPQVNRSPQRQQAPAIRSPLQQRPATGARASEERHSPSPNGETRQHQNERQKTPPGRTAPNPAAAQQRPDARRQTPPRDNRHGATAHTERYSGPRNYTPGRRPPQDARPRQFSARDYNHNYQAAHRYHYRPYERPRGWYERRWYYGERLPPLFWARNYWLSDYWMFGLAIPPYGYEWVRYGDDALLINTDSGQILQVVYGIFY